MTEWIWKDSCRYEAAWAPMGRAAAAKGSPHAETSSNSEIDGLSAFDLSV